MFSINLREKLTLFAKSNVLFKKRKHAKLSNAEGIVRIFRLGAELQLCVHNNGITFRISKLNIGPIKIFV